ncbi:MAG: hypothetical protein GY820_14040 [Gammaproteobacteria bacterium]|nr:hypothetical protein [Gammaproteobacteria bacterium]
MKAYYNVHTIWLVMMLMTLGTYLIGKQNFSGMAVVAFVFVTALIKGIFIIRDFMELKDVALLWRLITYGWLWVVILAIPIIYSMS